MEIPAQKSGLPGGPLQSIDKVDALPSKVCKQSFDCSPRALRCARARVSGGNPRITRPQPIFDGRSGTSISCKMAFSTKTLILRPEIDRGSNLRLPALGYRPAFAENDPLDHFPGASAPGDVHALGCRPAFTENHPLDDFPGVSAPADYNRRTCGPFDASQGLLTVCPPGPRSARGVQGLNLYASQIKTAKAASYGVIPSAAERAWSGAEGSERYVPARASLRSLRFGSPLAHLRSR